MAASSGAAAGGLARAFAADPFFGHSLTLTGQKHGGNFLGGIQASDTNGSDSQRFTVAAVPEPASCGLAAVAAAALLGRRRRVHESKL